MLVEKILRVQPGVRKLYLLVRAPDDSAARKRVLQEVTVFGWSIFSLFQFILSHITLLK